MICLQQRLQAIAMCELWDESALKEALINPRINAQDKEVINRYLSGQALSTDHVGLQDIALKIGRHA